MANILDVLNFINSKIIKHLDTYTIFGISLCKSIDDLIADYFAVSKLNKSNTNNMLNTFINNISKAKLNFIMNFCQTKDTKIRAALKAKTTKHIGLFQKPFVLDEFDKKSEILNAYDNNNMQRRAE